MINCGHCKQQHDTVAEVRNCSGVAFNPPSTNSYNNSAVRHAVERNVANGSTHRESHRRRGATDKQLDYIKLLLDSREVAEGRESALQRARNMSSSQASSFIDQLKSLPKIKEVKSAGKSIELEDGIYRDPSTNAIFKVYHTVRGANQQVAKELIFNPDDLDIAEQRECSFEYRGKAGLKGLTPEMRMTLEEAKEFGALYGVCCNCGATLTAEESIEAGIGPICAQKFA